MDNLDPKEILKMYFSAKTLPHAFLFTGQSSKKMQEYAQFFAHQMMERFKCSSKDFQKLEELTHPDFNLFYPDSKSGQYSIEQIRAITKASTLYPHESPCQFFILNYAERMQDAAANSLLKTLEEPTERTTFILLAENSDSMLPTILSRLQKVHFGLEKTAKDESETLKNLLDQWPAINYHKIASACEQIEKEITTKEVPAEPYLKEVHEDHLATTLWSQVEKWVQNKELEASWDLTKKYHFEKAFEQSKQGLKSSIKLVTALEHLLLSLT